ncbi:MAG: hypothetical protein R3E90_00055 [Marinicella sp.]
MDNSQESKFLNTGLRSIIILMIFTLPCGAQDKYENPVDGKTYETDKWNVYKPEGYDAKSHEKEHVSIDSVRLLISEYEVDSNLEIEVLAEFITTIRLLAERIFDPISEDAEILLQVTLHKTSRQYYEVMYQGELSEEILQAFYDGLEDIPELNTLELDVPFQIHFVIRKP